MNGWRWTRRFTSTKITAADRIAAQSCDPGERMTRKFGPPKSHPASSACQCYPEGRSDCPDAGECRIRLGYTPQATERNP